MKNLFFLFIFCFVFGCKSHKIDQQASIELRFLDDYVIPAEATFENTKIGGLSGIDYTGKDYLVVSDQKANPRFYRIKIQLQNKKIDTVTFEKVVQLDTETTAFLKDNYLDLESIRYHPKTKNVILSNEGSISKGKNPSVFSTSPEGKFISSYSIPPYFEAKSTAEPQNNGLFEGLSISSDLQGIWVGTELPLKVDGPKPMLIPTTSPIRITYFNTNSKKPEKQFVYLLDSIAKVPLLPFYVNGLSDMLTIAPDKFLIIERGFSSGLGQHGNTIRIYLTDISKATNTLNKTALKKKMKTIIPAEKTLAFDFKSVEKQLTNGIIDNIEGITFGPNLPNGNKTLLLIADNNFNSLGPQLNQIILMEILVK